MLLVPHVDNRLGHQVFLQPVLKLLQVGNGLELYAIGQMLLLDPEKIPDAPPYDLDRASYQGQEIFISEAGDDGRREGHGPGRSHDEVEDNDDIVISGGGEGEVLSEEEALVAALEQVPVHFEVPVVGVKGGDCRYADPRCRIGSLV